MTHSYSSKGNKRYRYYVCGTAMQRGWAVCPSPSVPAGEIERFVVEQINVAITFHPTGLKSLTQQSLEIAQYSSATVLESSR